MGWYSWVFKVFFTKIDPEKAHKLAFIFIRLLNRIPWLVRWYTKPDPALKTFALGMEFPSPFGLAAGFDKNGEAITGLTALGFGHVEVGTLTAHAQTGNPKPRLFRLVKDRALINRMGFNNSGSKAAIKPIQKALLKNPKPIIGINIGKSKITKVEDATADYVSSARRLAPLADFMVVNVSSPNTPGLRGLQELRLLEPLLSAVLAEVRDKPLLVKIAPDMPNEQIKEIVSLIAKIGLAGIIATNTTVTRENLTTSGLDIHKIGQGGLSGEPLSARSLEVLKLIKSVAPKNLCVISVGGVSSAEDVLERLNAGADLVQGYSAFIYEGPFWARKINKDLARYLTGR